ncbi:OLC1v1005002C1 [Oldenlandia corymbosa var. corymbosa]|uniref:OLC1v1005002C1 n=1 Tax=Oldenlandia corymbosa var. corymbosa TaxID=529605 RepID=A0AAV1DDV4_OLDCO|nr:OLC1v1005002C1 [Oldenlandia corymbosa var. corymbosa]
MGTGTSLSHVKVGISRDGSLFENPANKDCMEDHSDPDYEDYTAGSYHLEAGTSRGRVVFENPANEDYMYYTDPNDSAYTVGSGESEEGLEVSSESDNSGYESENFEEEELETSVPGRHIYREMGKGIHPVLTEMNSVFLSGMGHLIP